MKNLAKAAFLIAALPAMAHAQTAPQDACASISQEAITTSFNALPETIRAALTKFPNFSAADASCKRDMSAVHSHSCFERAALLHNEWIVIFHSADMPEGKGHAFVWKVAGNSLAEVSWPDAYASLCTLEKLGAIRDGNVLSKAEGKPAVFAPIP